MTHLSITQSGAVALLTVVVGQLIAFVPSLGPDKQNLISAGTFMIAAVFMVVNAIHAHAASRNAAPAPVPAPASAAPSLKSVPPAV